MRASGVLMGISSLPSSYGIGCFSREAYEFVDMETLLISPALLLQETRILSAWKI